DAASVEVQFEDGSSVTIPVVWVSAPIDAGFFGYEVPAAHLRVGARPTLLILHDAKGNELRRDSSAFEVPAFRHGPSTGLAPCLTRGGGDACLADRKRRLAAIVSGDAAAVAAVVAARQQATPLRR